MAKAALTRGALRLLHRLAKCGDDAEIRFDGRNCRGLLRCGLVRVKRTKDGKRITNVYLTKKGRNFLTPEDLLDVAAASAAMAEPGPNIPLEQVIEKVGDVAAAVPFVPLIGC